MPPRGLQKRPRRVQKSTWVSNRSEITKEFRSWRVPRASWRHFGASWLPRRLQKLPRRLRGAFKSLPDAPKNVQDAPKNRQDVSWGLQSARQFLGNFVLGAFLAILAHLGLQDVSNNLQGAFKNLQDASKTLPRCLQQSPRRAQDAFNMPQELPRPPRCRLKASVHSVISKELCSSASTQYFNIGCMIEVSNHKFGSFSPQGPILTIIAANKVRVASIETPNYIRHIP